MSRYSRNPNVAHRTLLTSVCILCVGVASTLHSQEAAKVLSEFKNPGKQYRPMVRWWWPGTAVTDKEIEREVGLLDSAGFGGAEIQPFVTFDPKTLTSDVAARVNDYATPSFFQHVHAATNAAKAHGMWMDYTFGSGWPFGGGLAITPELAAIELRSEDTVVDGPKVFSEKLSIPDWKPGLIASMMIHSGIKPDWPADWQARMDARSRLIAIVAMRTATATKKVENTGGPRQPEMLDKDSAIVLTDKLRSDGTLNWQVPEGTWHIFAFRQIPTRQPVIGAAGTGPQLVLDHLNKAAFEAHATRVGQPLVGAVGSELGTSLRAIFCDSLELQQYVFWSDDFLKQFQTRRGYDLTPFLAILRQPGYNDFYFSHPGGLPLFDVAGDGDAIRRDYWKTVSELMFEGFYHPFDEWAKDHKLLSRVQAHGAPADVLKLYGDASIPETEELDGDNKVNFLKLASSAGYDYGRKLVSSESFVFRGNPYITTPQTIKANTDKLLISGVNEIIYHGFPYDFDDGTKGVGWFPFQGQFSSQINEHNPIWPFIAPVNKYITRLQYIAQQGKGDLQVAIFRSALNEEDTGPTPASGVVKDPFPAIEEGLTAAGYSFGFVNDDVLLASSASNGKLTTKGGGQYSAVIIPHEANVSAETIKTLEAVASGHIPIVFIGGLPGKDVSFKDMEQQQASVAVGLQKLTKMPTVKQAVSATDASIQLAEAVKPQVRFASGDILPFVKKTLGSTRFYLLTNPTNKATNSIVSFTENASPESWDAWTGDIKPIATSRVDGRVNVTVALPSYGSQLIAFNDSHKNGVVPSALEETKRQTVGDTGWSLNASGNSEKGVGIELHLTMAKLVDYLDEPDLKTFSGRVTYVTHVSLSGDDLQRATAIELDLGQVKDAAEVKVNGVMAATLVAEPFSADVRKLLHAGENEISVTIANSLTNYVSTIKFPKNPANPIAHYPPISSGLLGPVSLVYLTEGSKH